MDANMETDALKGVVTIHKYGHVYPKIERYAPACIMFDADGVLVDACDIHYEALNKAILRAAEGCLYYCIEIPEHHGRFNGLPTREKLKILTKERGMPEYMHEEIFKLKQMFTHQKLKKLPIQPDTVNLLVTLRSMGIKTAMCSNAIVESCIAMAKATGVYNLLDAIFGNESVKKNKPAPDIWLKCADALGVKMEDCVIVEDSHIGIESAMAANPRTIVRVSNSKEVNLSLLSKLLA